MIAHLCWIGAVYALAALAVHALHARKSRPRVCVGREGCCILITRNHQDVVEWYIRTLGLLSLLGGVRMRMAVEDCGSMDQTMEIVRRLEGKCAMEVEIRPYRGDESRKAPTEAVLDLRFRSGPLGLSALRRVWTTGVGEAKH
ncbi:hypothetical protein [Paenibacillus glufosinatiresistens]|uniref:hypothetical protein n=1 Tax=Paenibacillus glufosinatiresistens TaxID=3070657 RepID=UPI00286E8F40|nr:hypothetical protein [Paenibacillus sp. YX.27]